MSVLTVCGWGLTSNSLRGNSFVFNSSSNPLYQNPRSLVGFVVSPVPPTVQTVVCKKILTHWNIEIFGVTHSFYFAFVFIYIIAIHCILYRDTSWSSRYTTGLTLILGLPVWFQTLFVFTFVSKTTLRSPCDKASLWSIYFPVLASVWLTCPDPICAW